jgi:hypothetical protein
MFMGFTIGFGLILLFRSYPDLLPDVTGVLQQLRPIANADFYLNRLRDPRGDLHLRLHRGAVRLLGDRPERTAAPHGIMSNLKRYAAPQLRVEKEIPDVFEYLLLRSGPADPAPLLTSRGRSSSTTSRSSAGRNARSHGLLGALQVRVRGEG